MISLIILGIIFLYAIISYNTLTRKRNNVDNAFGSIDVMLKNRRFQRVGSDNGTA